MQVSGSYSANGGGYANEVRAACCPARASAGAHACRRRRSCVRELLPSADTFVAYCVNSDETTTADGKLSLHCSPRTDFWGRALVCCCDACRSPDLSLPTEADVTTRCVPRAGKSSLVPAPMRAGDDGVACVSSCRPQMRLVAHCVTRLPQPMASCPSVARHGLVSEDVLWCVGVMRAGLRR